ncbi:secretory phospholipase A2 receptor-like [Cololabis saira]|uniref:secretory phospholipase A2 receptor-like n=1 Tax=Cololabis saira TaxID=129043 RepID=UPI002AD598E8|nr:secretory phospholipase A2 receptor-like [Cololabis saira]
MERIIISLLIVTSSCGFSAKHVFIQNPLSWTWARDYCRVHHTDLVPITNDLEEKVFRESVGGDGAGWIGLYCSSRKERWRWSGGTAVTKEKRARGFVAAYNWTGHGSYPTFGWSYNNFFCLNLVVVQEGKTWKEAKQHCKGAQAQLATLLSETEKILATREIRDPAVTGQVWIGLHYHGSWHWENRDPLEYEAWSPAGDPDPPGEGCGALTKGGVWVKKDCSERLHFICA